MKDNKDKSTIAAVVKAGNVMMSVSEPENGVVRINIDGDIGGWDWDTWEPVNTGKQLREAIDAIVDADEIEVLISSLGGDVDAAMQIYDALVEKKKKCRITTIVTGLCASAATVIACAGSVRKISPNSLYLIHKCWGRIVGNENEIEEYLDFQRKINDRMKGIYSKVFKGKPEELDALMEAANGNGKWITAGEALEYGFATEMWYDEEDDSSQARAQRSGIMASVLNKARSIRQPKTVIESVSSPDNNISAKPGEPAPVIKINVQQGGIIKIADDNDSILQTQIQTKMKKILSTFAMLGALLAIGAEQEFDETKGLTLSTEQLGKVEDELKALREKADQLAKAQEDLTKAKQELKAAQEKAESDSKAIETLTAERDSFKAKYEAKPAAIQTPAAADPEEGQESEDLKAMYAELEKMY